MKTKQIERLLHLLRLLQAAGRGYDAESLAEACGVSRRTIFRDLDLLRNAGLQLWYDEEQRRYKMPGPRMLPPTSFTSSEALALITLCHEIGGRHALPFLSEARSAVMKLENALPIKLREQVQASAEAIQINMPPVNPLDDHQGIYDELVNAAASKRSVRIVYEAAIDEGRIQTRLNPYHLLFSRRSWYVIGRSSVHREVRTFNVGRIQRLELLEDTFEVPRNFSVERFLHNAWHLIPERGPDHQVVIRFDKLVAKNVAEVVWHKTQATEFTEEGDLIFRATVSGLNEISWWILGYGDRAEVINPPELRRVIAGHASRMSRLYRQHVPN